MCASQNGKKSHFLKKMLLENLVDSEKVSKFALAFEKQGTRPLRLSVRTQDFHY